jgi:hypothetical protein
LIYSIDMKAKWIPACAGMTAEKESVHHSQAIANRLQFEQPVAIFASGG